MSFTNYCDLYICIILTLEYVWGRPDAVVKNEAKQKKRLREKHNFEHLTTEESK